MSTKGNIEQYKTSKHLAYNVFADIYLYIYISNSLRMAVTCLVYEPVTAIHDVMSGRVSKANEWLRLILLERVYTSDK